MYIIQNICINIIYIICINIINHISSHLLFSGQKQPPKWRPNPGPDLPRLRDPAGHHGAMAQPDEFAEHRWGDPDRRLALQAQRMALDGLRDVFWRRYVVVISYILYIYLCMYLSIYLSGIFIIYIYGRYLSILYIIYIYLGYFYIYMAIWDIYIYTWISCNDLTVLPNPGIMGLISGSWITIFLPRDIWKIGDFMVV